MSGLLLCGCSESTQSSASAEPTTEPSPSQTPEPAALSPVPSQKIEAVTHHPWEANLLAWCDSREEAEQIAEHYHIELIYWEHVAMFYTNEDPQTVIDRGAANGWEKLSLNHTNTLSRGGKK